MSGKLCLIGYRGLKQVKFYSLLQQANVEVLLDVRRNPYSPNPLYRKQAIETDAPTYNIRYHHVPQLGIPGAGNSPIFPGEAQNLREQLQTREARRALGGILKLAQQNHSVALMCAEPDYRECHRMVLVKMLLKAHESLVVEELTGHVEKGLFELLPA